MSNSMDDVQLSEITFSLEEMIVAAPVTPTHTLEEMIVSPSTTPTHTDNDEVSY